MGRDPIDALLRVRRLALDEARRALAACLDAEHAAALARGSAEAEVTRERQAAERTDAGDTAVEAFAAWLPRARERVLQSVQRYERSAAETARARAALGVARGAHEAAEEALARKRAALGATQRKHEQAVLDEAAARSANPTRGQLSP